jgi:hypothetical protein
MGINFDDTDPPVVETVPEGSDDDYDLEDDAASNAGSEMSMSEYGGSVKELPPWCLFAVNECRCIFELSQDKAVFYRVCGNTSGNCKRPGHAAGEKAAVGYYEPIKARKFIDGKFNTFLTVEEFAGKERERIEAKAKEMAMASARFASPKTSPTMSEEELYFKARPADVKLMGVDTPSYAEVAAASSSVPSAILKREAKPILKTPPPYSINRNPITKPAPIDTNLEAPVGDAAIVQSPTLKKMHGSGVKTDTMDPAVVMMMAMMDQLSKTMVHLSSKVDDISARPLIQPDVKPAVTSSAPTKEPVKPLPAPKAEIPAPKTKYFYGIGHGLDGAHGIYTSWGEAAPLVVGVSKAIFQRFGTWEEAQDFVSATQALRRQQAEAQPTGTALSDVWYAVTNSKNGSYDIFPNWPAAQLHVVNISGASVRKFRTYGEAQGYVEGHASAWEQSTAGKPAREALKLQPKPASTVSSNSVTTQPNNNHNVGPTTKDVASLYPPGKLMGEDPSTGKADEVFNIDIEIGEEELQDALCPPDLSEAMARSLINGTIDAVALPGGLNSGGELEGAASDVGMLGEALEELVTQNRGTAGRTGRPDLRWRNEKRTSIRGLTSETKLRTRIKHLKKLMPKVQKRMEALSSSTCKRSGWDDPVRIHTWSAYGYLPVIVMSSLRGYIALHEHLLELATDCGWAYVIPELDHHVEEMELLRTLADSRIHAICSLYCYLRDCKNQSWYSTSIQQKRNVAMVTGEQRTTKPQFPPFTESETTSTSAKSPGMAALCCIKCHTCLHTGGSEACPWKNQSDENARKAGAKALKNLATGNSTRPQGKGKEKDGD